MSMTRCLECKADIDTDDSPEAYYFESQQIDFALCEDCHADFDGLDLEAKHKKSDKWQDDYEKWLHKPIREFRHA